MKSIISVSGPAFAAGPVAVRIGRANLKVFGLKDRATLTKSFRFGPEIAKVANSVLERLDADLRIEGAGPASVVGPIAEPECILTRTNAVAVELALKALADHKRVALVGGAQDVVSFAKASDELREKGWTSHPELACFESWQEVLDYTAYDEQGGDLRLLVKLIEDFGTDTIIRGLGQTVEEGDADLVISTAHKAKGREWPSVQLAGDFDPAPSTEGEEREAGASELRLLYVAATRAKLELDVSACKLLGGDPADVDAKALTALYGTRSGR